MVDEDLNEEATEAESSPPKKKGKLMLMLLLLVVLGGGGAGGWYLLAGSGETEGEAEVATEDAHGDPIYFTLAENLVVNFRSPGGTRFLQVGIDLMTYDEDGRHALEQHAPVLKSELILLLSDQTQETLLSREGKETLREEALTEVRGTMRKLHGSPVVESLYFTSFVMQ